MSAPQTRAWLDRLDEAEEEKKNKFPEWRSKRYGKKDTTSEEDI